MDEEINEHEVGFSRQTSGQPETRNGLLPAQTLPKA